MKKWWFNSLLLAGLVSAAACHHGTSAENTSQPIDSPQRMVTGDTLAPKDRMTVGTDAKGKTSDTSIVTTETHAANKPGERPKPGTRSSRVDSIKNSYPPKK